jgi:hypothetical protein
MTPSTPTPANTPSPLLRALPRWPWELEQSLAGLLALVTTAVALALAAAAALERVGPGDALRADAVLTTATAVMLALGAQLLPAFSRRRPWAWPLWGACLLATLYGHAHFFAAAAERAGAARAGALSEPSQLAAWREELRAIEARPLATVAAEVASAQARVGQAEAGWRACERLLQAPASGVSASACARSRATLDGQEARARAIQVELAEAQRAVDLRARLSGAAAHMDEARRQANQNPVDRALVELTGLPSLNLALVSSLAQSLLVELLSALLWWVAASGAGPLQRSRPGTLRGLGPARARATSALAPAKAPAPPAPGEAHPARGPLALRPVQAALFEEEGERRDGSRWRLSLAASRAG